MLSITAVAATNVVNSLTMSDMPSSGPVPQEMIHPTALEPITNKEMNAPKVGAGVSPPPTPPSKDDEDMKKGAQPSSYDFNPLTADTDSVHNDSHAKSVESVEPGASTHEPKPFILQHDNVESTKATSSGTQEESTSEQDKPTPYIVPEAITSPQVKELDEAPEPGPSTEKIQQKDDTIEQATSIATGPTAATTTDHDGKTTTTNGNQKQANGDKENGHGAAQKLKREISKKKPLFGFLKKACDDDDVHSYTKMGLHTHFLNLLLYRMANVKHGSFGNEGLVSTLFLSCYSTPIISSHSPQPLA